ncbi:hypothetical protein B0E38_07879 [Streptomyces sp. 111WW2]|nr:hypothetical protein B0E38_07879 [Streptomyces sp. 111WW2]
MQGDRGERRAVVAVAADEFGGQVLGLGGAAAVARGEQPAAAAEYRREPVAPPLGDVRGGAERHERHLEFVAVPDDGRVHGHDATSVDSACSERVSR